MMKRINFDKFNHCQGLSLVELMVAVAISMILLAGIGNIYVSNKQVYLLNEEHSRLQESARVALSTISKEVRMAGYKGCNSEMSGIGVALNGVGGNWLFDLPAGIRGYEGGVSTFPGEFSALAVANTDALSVIRADTDDLFTVTSVTAGSASTPTQIHLSANHNLKKGEILVISDCRQSTVFQMTNDNPANSISVVEMQQGGTVIPGNCANSYKLGTLTQNTDCSSPSTDWVQYLFNNAGNSDDPKLSRLLASSFFIGSNSGVPTLYMTSMVHGAATGTTVGTTTIEIADGVADMEILYGEDKTSTANSPPNRFQTADAVTNWDDVSAIRLSLLMRSHRQINPTPQTYTWKGSSVTATDNYIYRTFSTTIKIRNRGDR